jgi:hypothetical protein
MNANAREKIRMLARVLEPIEREVGRVLSDEEDKLASSSAASKETAASSDRRLLRYRKRPRPHAARCRRGLIRN